MGFSRRAFLAGLAAGGAAETLPPIRAIARGPKFHWFGYYDKLQFDPTGRYALGMETGFEHRSPRPDDAIRLGMIDLERGDRWIDLAETRAWCWQQGSMLQWLPGSSTDVIFNDREDDHYVSRILNVRTGKQRTLPGPVYALSPDARWAVSTDFSRLADTRPGYGYAGVPDRYKDVLAPDETGIWRMDLASGKRDLILTYAAVARVPYKIGDWTGAKHKINHLLVSPDGSRFIFLHRRRGGPNPEAGATRMFTANPDGSGLYVLDPYGRTSHFIWRGSRHVVAWANHPSHGNKFYEYEDRTENVRVVAPDVMTENGHNTYLPGDRWILNDTYPDKQRLQHPYLYDTQTGRRHPLGHFLSPPEYTGEWRCDTHPRFSPDGRKVVIDSPHNGGRQMYLIDIGAIAG
ncbi:MAG: TolB family protein [Bryobacteraceae bacterium]